jgi:hypothetical protein
MSGAPVLAGRCSQVCLVCADIIMVLVLAEIQAVACFSSAGAVGSRNACREGSHRQAAVACVVVQGLIHPLKPSTTRRPAVSRL